MKTIKLTLLVLISLMLIGCSTDDDSSDCQCIKESYEIQTDVVFDANGLPHLQFTEVFLYDEVVVCTEEGTTWTSDDTYFNIICN